MKKIMFIDKYSGECDFINEKDFEEFGVLEDSSFEKVVSNEGIVSYNNDEELFVILDFELKLKK